MFRPRVNLRGRQRRSRLVEADLPARGGGGQVSSATVEVNAYGVVDNDNVGVLNQNYTSS